MSATLRVNGAELVADLSGALWWPEAALLAFADLHLEKGSSYAPRGALLPPYDTRTTLARMADAIARFRPRTVACLGDSFHDGDAASRLDAADAAALARLVDGRDWLWVAGNHDPKPPAGLGGRSVEELAVGPLRFRHEAVFMTAPGEVSGHFHPKASVSHRGRRVTGRCFASDGRRLVLPAFGAYAGGLSVTDPALAGLFPDGFVVWMLGRSRVHRLPAERLSR
ncbi:MAG TPA: ligase-associated DNA damage response endonuclease PdeM [Alphaproteobacteria bacterium]